MAVTLFSWDSTCRRNRIRSTAQRETKGGVGVCGKKASRHFEEQGIICPANKTFFWIGFRIEWEREKREKIEREWWQWPLLLSTLIAALMPVMLQRQPRQRGIGWRWWNRLRGFPVPGGLAEAQQKTLCTATQLLLLSQRRSRRRGSSWVGGLGSGLTGGGEWEEEFGRRKGVGCWIWHYGKTHLIGPVNGEKTVGMSCWGFEWKEDRQILIHEDQLPRELMPSYKKHLNRMRADMSSIWRRAGM